MISFLLLLLIICTKFSFSKANRITELISIVFCVHLILYFHVHNISNKILLWLGSFSYTKYLTHFASIYLFKIMLISLGVYSGGYIYSKFIWPIGVIFSLSISYILYFFAEKPTKKILGRTRGN